MTEFKVNVKWGKQTFKGLDLNTAEPPEVFKAQIYTLTSVPIDRQTLMIKGTTIKETWPVKAKLKNGAMFLLLGSAEELPSEPAVKTVFLEDMTESELVSAMDLSSGLQNLGNTCYMNATLQVLKTIPELNTALQKYEGVASASNMQSMGTFTGPITATLRDLFTLMDKKSETDISPLSLILLFRMHYPQFAEKDEHGHPLQQDANECLMEIMRIFQLHLPAQLLAPNAEKSIIDRLFEVEYRVAMKCIEEGAEEEKESVTSEKALQLNCFISQEVKYLITGLNSKLKEEIVKKSPTLDRDAKYTKTAEVSRLPGYLCVQMMRFFFKKGNINAKILKEVKFPLQLDVYDLCSDELKKKLAPMRKKFEDEDERKNEEKAQLKAKNVGKMKTNELNEETKTNVEYEKFYFEDDFGSNNSGYYELQGVITHKGRSSSSGHYVGWVKQSQDTWLKCDDDIVTPVTPEDVLKLCGGGDWHTGYILLYGPRKLEKVFPKPEAVNVAEPVCMETETTT